MKKIVSLLLAAVFILSLASCTITDTDKTVLKVGSRIEGFIVKEIRDFPLVGAVIYLMEHEKTGAELVYIANNDTNRVFDLTFFISLNIII